MNNRTRVAAAGTSSRGDTTTLTQQALTGCVLTLLIVWTLAGNFTVCVAVFRFRHLRAKVTNIFIASLAVSDLLVAILVMPWKAVAEVVGYWPFGAFCNTWVACDIMCSTASILNLCVISVDRYWAISSPFMYERNMNKKVASVMIGVTWTVSVVISFVPVQLNWHRAEMIGEPTGHNNVTFHGTSSTGSGVVGDSCETNLSRTYAISTSLISFYIPVAIMIVTYTRIYQIAQVQIRRISSLERAAVHAQRCRSDASEHLSHLCPPDLNTNPTRPRTHTQPHRTHLHHQPHGHRTLRVSIRKETKVLKTLSIIMGVFVCCWFPFFVLNCALPFCPGPRSPGAAGARSSSPPAPYCVSAKTFDIFVWFGWSNSSLNPIIYALNADFRNAFLRLLGCRGGGGCLGAGGAMSAAMETVVASNEAGYAKQDNSLDAELGVACNVDTTRRSEASGNTGVTLFHQRGTASEVMDTEDHKADIMTTGTDRRTEIPLCYITTFTCQELSNDK